MIDFCTINKIRKEAISSMKSDANDNEVTSKWSKFAFFIVFYIVPIFMFIIPFFKCIRLSNLETYIGTGIAIFTGLFFSLLINIGSKIKNEKNNPNKDENNFQKYKTSMKQIANITLYIIELGIFIFLLMLLNSIFKMKSHQYIEIIFTSISLYYLWKFIISLFYLIQRLYYLVRDEISNVL